MRKPLQLFVTLLALGAAAAGALFVSTAASGAAQECTPMDIQYGHCAQTVPAVCNVVHTGVANTGWRVDIALPDSPAEVPPSRGGLEAGQPIGEPAPPLFGSATFTADGQMDVSCASPPREPGGPPTGFFGLGSRTGAEGGISNTAACDAFRGPTLAGAATYEGNTFITIAFDDNGSVAFTCHLQLVSGSP